MSKFLKTAILTVSVLSLTISNFSNYASVDSEKQNKILIQNQIEKVFSDSHSRYYKINNLNVSIDDWDINNGNLEAKASVNLKETLKAQRVEELPYVKGMLKKVNIGDFQYESKQKTDEIVAALNKNKLKNDQIAKAAKHINNKFEDLKQYIGNESELNYFLKVSAKLVNNNIDKTSIVILSENGNGEEWIPLEKALPSSVEQMESEGAMDIQSSINAKDTGFSPSLYANYNRIAARDYANAHTSGTSTKFCI